MNNPLHSSIRKMDYYVNNQIEKTEEEFLRRKTFYINIIIIVVAAFSLALLLIYNVPYFDIFIYALVFTEIITINFLFYRHKKFFKNIKLAMYITTIGIYLITVSLIIQLQILSLFTMIFFSYALILIYQDKQASWLNNILLFIAGTWIIWFYPSLFIMQNIETANTLYIFVFLLIFVLLLSVASFVLINRKNYFLYKITKIKELELRIIDTVFDMEKTTTNKRFDYKEYYDQLNNFTQEISKKIGIDNVFSERIQILKEMQSESINTIIDKYPNYNKNDMLELKQLELSTRQKIRYLAFKGSQAESIKISKAEVFSEAKTESLRHFSDDLNVKILAFSVFLTVIMQERYYGKKSTFDDFLLLLESAEFKHIIDEDILTVFKDNLDDFKSLFHDTLKNGGVL